jgi:hypothetical protein
MGNKLDSTDANAVIDRLREVVGVRTDTALCDVLGFGSSVVSTWRRRGHIPYAECVAAATRAQIPLDWLLLGRGTHGAGAGDAQSQDVTEDGDPRAGRMIGFIRAWRASHDDDDMAWLERTLARSVQEYGEWLAAHVKAEAGSRGAAIKRGNIDE